MKQLEEWVSRFDRTAPVSATWAHSYVYFLYGIHYCFNVVTEREGLPAAVLIRALEPLEGIEDMRARRSSRPDAQLTSGPAHPCQALDIDRRFDGADLCAPGALLFPEEDAPIPNGTVVTGSRIGVRGDEVAVTLPWRFYVRKTGTFHVDESPKRMARVGQRA